MKEILILMAVVFVVLAITGWAANRTHKNFGKAVFFRMTSDRNAGVSEGDIQYTLVTTYNLDIATAKECLANYGRGLEWFEAKFKDH
jgi:hypothetical protein